MAVVAVVYVFFVDISLIIFFIAALVLTGSFQVGEAVNWLLSKAPWLIGAVSIKCILSFFGYLKQGFGKIQSTVTLILNVVASALFFANAATFLINETRGLDGGFFSGFMALIGVVFGTIFYILLPGMAVLGIDAVVYVEDGISTNRRFVYTVVCAIIVIFFVGVIPILLNGIAPEIVSYFTK